MCIGPHTHVRQLLVLALTMAAMLHDFSQKQDVNGGFHRVSDPITSAFLGFLYPLLVPARAEVAVPRCLGGQMRQQPLDQLTHSGAAPARAAALRMVDCLRKLSGVHPAVANVYAVLRLQACADAAARGLAPRPPIRTTVIGQPCCVSSAVHAEPADATVTCFYSSRPRSARASADVH